MNNIFIYVLVVFIALSCYKETELDSATITTAISLKGNNQITVFDTDESFNFEISRKNVNTSKFTIKKGSSTIKTIDVSFTDGKGSFSSKEFGSLSSGDTFTVEAVAEVNGVKSMNSFTINVIPVITISSKPSSVDSASKTDQIIKIENNAEDVSDDSDFDEVEVLYNIKKGSKKVAVKKWDGITALGKKVKSENYKDTIKFTAEDLITNIAFKIGDTINYYIALKKGSIVDTIKNSFKITTQTLSSSKTLEFSDKVNPLKGAAEVFYNLDSATFDTKNGHLKFSSPDTIQNGDVVVKNNNTDEAETVEFIKVDISNSKYKTMFSKGDFFKIKKFFDDNVSSKVSSFSFTDGSKKDTYAYKVTRHYGKENNIYKIRDVYGIIEASNYSQTNENGKKINKLSINIREGYKK